MKEIANILWMKPFVKCWPSKAETVFVPAQRFGSHELGTAQPNLVVATGLGEYLFYVW